MVKLKFNFDIEPYLAQFLKKHLHIQCLADIEKIYVSKEYSQFITDLYNFFNDNHEVDDAQLAKKLIINYFWTSFIGPNLSKYILGVKKG
ncbi:MAG: hypothetical protein ACFE9R_08700 [Candidatus Hermodarchaeota archaeon]